MGLLLCPLAFSFWNTNSLCHFVLLGYRVQIEDKNEQNETNYRLVFTLRNLVEAGSKC